MLNRKFYLLILCLVSFLPTLYSQAPEGINYQAVARDANGDIMVNQAISVRLTILENSSIGSIVYQETHATSTNDFGLFTAVIGEGVTVTGTFANIDWGSNDHFLQVEADIGSGIIDLGTTQLMSVPYALYAKEVAGGGGSGDDWGNQVVQTDGTLSGDGTSGNELGLAQQGAANGEVLTWNGSQWEPATPSGGSGLWQRNGNYVYNLNDSIGIGVLDPMAKLHVDENEDVLFGGITGDRFMWISDKGAFRAGLSTNSGWDPDSIGNRSVAFGHDTKALDSYSVAFGRDTRASGILSMATGSNTTASNHSATAMGRSTIASGFQSTAMGRSTLASGQYSTATGHSTSATGNYSITMGGNSVASGDYAAAMGLSTLASGQHSTATGHSTSATGNHSITMGKNSVASGTYAAAMGFNTIASGTSSLAMGDSSSAEGFSSVAIGLNTNAIGNHSIALGYDAEATGLSATAVGRSTSASGRYATSFGNGTIASGNFSLATGRNSIASGSQSTAMGYLSKANTTHAIAIGRFALASGETAVAIGEGPIASGDYSLATGHSTWAAGSRSTAMGEDTYAAGRYSTAMGQSTTAESGYETVIGRFNTSYSPSSTTGWNSPDRLFVIGNGTSATTKSDALVVLKNGNIGIGTSTPDNPLEVHGNVQSIDQAVIYGEFTDTSENSETALMGVNSNGIGGNFQGRVAVLAESEYNNVSVGLSAIAKGLDTALIAAAVQAFARDAEIGYGIFASAGDNSVANFGIYATATDTSASSSTAGFFNGDLTYTGSLSNPSDRKFKDEIEPLEGTLDKVRQIETYSYRYKETEGMNFSNGRQMGFIAQELEQLFPELIKDEINAVPPEKGSEEDPLIIKYKGINYLGMIPVLTQAIKEQQTEIETLQQENAELKKLEDKYQALEQRLSDLESQ